MSWGRESLGSLSKVPVLAGGEAGYQTPQSASKDCIPDHMLRYQSRAWTVCLFWCTGWQVVESHGRNLLKMMASFKTRTFMLLKVSETPILFNPQEDNSCVRCLHKLNLDRRVKPGGLVTHSQDIYFPGAQTCGLGSGGGHLDAVLGPHCCTYPDLQAPTVLATW